MYFLERSDQGTYALEPVPRKVSKEQDKVGQLVRSLLSGPTPGERRRGLKTEIPRDTELLSLQETTERIEVDLSQEFAKGGGSRSMIIRVRQLQRTIASSGESKPVYVSIEGEPLSRIGGEGLEVDVPAFRGTGGDNQAL